MKLTPPYKFGAVTLGARLAMVIGAALLLAFLAWYGLRGWTPSKTDYPVQGIDVSHHQGEIDWAAVKADGADFAYIKATEGADMRDDRFATNWKHAAESGVRRGAYHFFTLCRLARDQATNFITTVPRDPAALPPVVDLEFGGNCKERPDRAVLLAEIATFIKMVEAHAEKPVMLYVTREFENQYQVSAAIRRPLWLRSIMLTPSYGSHPWVMWQASSFARVDGIDGRVDWNVLRP
jgi:lysozyme